jgi:gliding motility-associated-like protein
MRRTGLLHALLLILFCGGFTYTFAQPNITGRTPVKPVYATGEVIRFYGSDIYDNPAALPFPSVITCDSMIWRNTTTNIKYGFRPFNTSNSQGDPNYTGVSGPTDTVRWVIPALLPCGTYFVKFNDDEDCNNPLGSVGDSIMISIKDSSFANYAIPGGIFCANGANPPLPTITPGDGGIFTELGTANIIANPSTGELMLHSGTIGMTHTIKFVTNGTPATCKDSTTFIIQIDSMRVQTLGYVGGNQFCQGPDTISVLPTFDGSSGIFSSFPATSALFPNGDFDLSAANAGSYAITYTPVGVCENPYTISIQVDSLVQADYDYAPIYCRGYNVTGPLTVNFLPPGGHFRQFGGTGLIFTDTLTGEIDVNATSPGTYIIEYVVTGGCSNLTRDTITVQAPPDPTFTIPNSVCSNVPTLAPTSMVTSGGTFIHTGSNITFSNASLGIIDVANSDLGGPYTIFYLVQSGVCQDTAEAHITIVDAPTADIEYPDSQYCANEPNPLPLFISGTSGGDFSINSTGVIVDSTGQVNLQGSGPGSYTITYFVVTSGCSATIPIDTISILAMPVTYFDVTDTTLCQGSGPYLIDTIACPACAPSSVFSMTNGQFVNFPGAIVGNNSINTNILPSGGPFRIVRNVDDGFCKDSLVRFVWILPLEDPSFVYAPDTFCQNDRNPVPLILGDGGGTFLQLNATATDSLSLDPLTGLITLANSTAFDHVVQYTTGGPCPQQATFTVVVTSATSPVFNYLVNSYCETDTGIIVPSQLPNPPYHFFCADSGLALDTLTGAFDIQASDTGTYNVILILDSIGGNCPTTATAVIDILAYNSSSIVFTDVVCATDSFLQIQYDTTLAGVFFAPSGLVWQDRPNGLIAVYATIPGTYLIRYEVNGVCAEKFSDTLTVESPTFPDFDFPFGQREFCISDDTTTAMPDTVGVFTWVDVQDPLDTVSLLLNPNTGGIDLSGSASGTYDITFTTSTACAGDTTKRITVFPNPANALMLLEPDDSICDGVPLSVRGSGAAYFEIRVNGVEVSNANSFTIDSLVDNDEVEMVFITQQLCRDSTDTIITVLPRPNGIPVVVSPTITGNQPINFEMETDVDLTSFTWTLSGFGNVTFSDESDSIPPILITERGTISTVATLGNGYDPAQAIFSVVPLAYGCYGDTDRVVIRINPNNEPIFIPEVFTPNDDGQNDTWLIQWNNSIRPEEYTLLLFNRSGGEVFTMNGLRETWTGDNLPDGVYWWHLLRGQPGQTITKGAVTIRRR